MNTRAPCTYLRWCVPHGLLAALVSFTASVATAQKPEEPGRKPPSSVDLIGRLHEQKSLVVHCQKSFARQWTYFNVKTGKPETVEASGADEITGSFLVVRNKADGKQVSIPVSMMSPASQLAILQYTDYARACHRATANLIGANGGSRRLEWTGRDGRPRTGDVEQLLLQPEGGSFEGRTPTGVSVFAKAPGALSGDWIPSEGFSPESTERLLKLIGTVWEPAGKEGAAVTTAFPRTEVPSFNQSDFKGGQSENCGPNAVADFVVWWDRIGVLPLPVTKRDEMDRAEWVHQRLFGVMRSGGGTTPDALLGGFKTYLERYYPRVASVKFSYLSQSGYNFGVERENFTIESVAEHVRGPNAAVLSVSQIKDGKPAAGHYVALTTAGPDGKVTINTWGYRFNGKMKQLSPEEIGKLPPRMVVNAYSPLEKQAVFEVVIDNPIPSMTKDGRRWLVLPTDSLLIIEPIFPK